MNIFGCNSFCFIVMSTFCCTLSFVSQAEEIYLNNELSLSVDAEVGHIDNFFSSKNDEKSSVFFVLSPKFDLRTETEQSLFEIAANVESVSYSQFSEDNHVDYSLLPRYQFKFARNQTLFVTGAYQHNYELRGTGLSIGNAKALVSGDEKAAYHVRTGFKYGSEHSAALWGIDVGYANSKYTSRREQTQVLDNSILSMRSHFDYLLSGKTYLAFELQHSDIVFENNAILDSTKNIALAGIKWATTEISELQLLLGYQKVSFKETTFSDDDTFKWRVDYLWKPTENTEFHFLSERSFEEANRLSNSYNVTDRHNISSTLRMTDQFHVNLSAGVVNQKINFQTLSEDEDIFTSSIALNYFRNERFKTILRYELNGLDATNSTIDYQRREISLAIEFNL